MKLLNFIISVFASVSVSCTQGVSSPSTEASASSSASSQILPEDVTKYVSGLNKQMSDGSLMKANEYIVASVVQDSDKYILVLEGMFKTQDYGSSESRKWSETSSDIITENIAADASKSGLFSSMRWTMDINEFRIKGSTTLPYDANSDYQKVVIAR